MNQERPRRGKSYQYHLTERKIARHQSPINSQLLEVEQNTPTHTSSKIILLHQPWWFWSQHSGWSYFNRGLFWGGIISLTAVCSAIAGVIATKIDVVEQAIAQRIEQRSSADALRPSLGSAIAQSAAWRLEHAVFAQDDGALAPPRSNSGDLEPNAVNSLLSIQSTSNQNRVFHNYPITVQNTTDNPQLGMEVVTFLRRNNFRDVRLVQHIPLKLNQTKIVGNYDRLATANYLQDILGFGQLEARPDLSTPELILQIGEDADYLFASYR